MKMTKVVSIVTGESLNLTTQRVGLDEARLTVFTMLEVGLVSRTGAPGCQRCGELAWERSGQMSYGVRKGNREEEKHRSPSVYSTYLIADVWEQTGRVLLELEKLHADH